MFNLKKILISTDLADEGRWPLCFGRILSNGGSDTEGRRGRRCLRRRGWLGLSHKAGFLALLQADAAAEQIVSIVLERQPLFTFAAAHFWLVEKFDQVLFAHDGAGPSPPEIVVDKLPESRLRRLEAMGYLPAQQRLGNPLYSGLLWKGTEIGLTRVKQLEQRSHCKPEVPID